MTVLVNLKKIFVTCQIQIFDQNFEFSIENDEFGRRKFYHKFLWNAKTVALSWLAKSNGQLLNPNETRTNLFISQNMKKHEKMTKINKN